MKIRHCLLVVAALVIAIGTALFQQSRTPDLENPDRFAGKSNSTTQQEPDYVSPSMTVEESFTADYQDLNQPSPTSSITNPPPLGRSRLSGIAHTEALRKAQVSLNPTYSPDEPADSRPANSRPATAIQPENTTGPTLRIPPGAILPAGFYEEAARTPQQQEALDRILMQFYEDITVESQEMSEIEVWENARYLADQRYKVLFGAKAFNDRHLAAAKEALREKRALNAASAEAPVTTN